MKKVLLFSLWIVFFNGVIYSQSYEWDVSDNASTTNYPSGNWGDGSNGGSGFTGWSFTSSGSSGRYIGGTAVGNPSFGIYSSSGGSYSAKRPFEKPLKSGDTFTVIIGHTATITGEIGLTLLDGTTGKITLKFVGGTSFWKFNDGGSDFDLGQGYSANTPLTFTFTYNGENSYSFTFGSASGNNFIANTDISGIDGVNFYNNNQGSGENFGFNNLAISGSASTAADVPTNADVEISGNVVLLSTESLTVNDLNIPSAKAGTLTIKSDASGTASLIVDGTISGIVTVERYVDEAAKAATWHYVSSPVTGQALNNTWMTNNSIAQSDPPESKYQLFRYDEDQNYWIIYGSTGTPEAFTDETFVEARGYSVARSAAGKLSFTGSIRTDNVTYPTSYTSDKGKGWNLVGNPFTSAIGVTSAAASTENFLSQNSGVIDASYLALYIWDEQGGYEYGENDYKIISNGTIGDYTRILQDYVESGQAFMVKVKPEAGNLAFNTNMQLHADVNFYKSKETWPSVELIVKGNGVSNSTSIGFHNDMTTGLDPSYDVGKLKGNPQIAVYTRLVEDNGVDFAIQALPFENIESYEIPIGISVSTTGVYEFTSLNSNFENYNIVLEDRQENTFTNLRWDTYFADINESGIGRFFLHFKDATGINTPISTKQPIITIQNNQLNISNLDEGKVEVRIMDIMGRVLDFRTFNTNSEISMPLQEKTGIYILEITSNHSIFAHKFFIR